MTLRNVPDADAMRQLAQRHAKGKAVVVGGGFIGVEAAENLKERGMAFCIGLNAEARYIARYYKQQSWLIVAQRILPC